MKRLMMALVVAAPVAMGLGGVDAAEAKTKVNIYLGIPHYGYQLGPDYVYRTGHGWYRSNRMSCGQARRIVRNKGYRNVITRDCRGSTYVFRGIRNNRPATLYVNARSGKVWRG